MSQAKVDKYKEEKARRRETIAKEKRNRFLGRIAGGLFMVAMASWILVSTVEFAIDNRPVNTYYADTTGIDDYLKVLFGEDETEEDKKEESTDDKEEDTSEVG